MNRFINDNPDSKKSKSNEPEAVVSRVAERKKVIGIALISFGILLFFSCLSFLFSFEVDTSLVERIKLSQFGGLNPAEYKNWIGFIGAWLGYKFIYSWFGVAAFIFPVLFVITGLQLGFKLRFLWYPHFFRTVFFALLWIPIAISLFIHGKWDFLAGGFGVYANLWLRSMVGMIGLSLILLASLISFLLLNFDFDLIEKLIVNKLKLDEETEIEESPTPINTPKRKPQPIVDDEQEEDFVATSDDYEPTRPKKTDENSRFSEVEEVIEKPRPKPPHETPQIEIAGLEIETAISDYDKVDKILAPDNQYDPTLDLSNYKYPTLELLNEFESKEHTIDTKELEDRKNLIVETLSNYKIDIDKIKATIGPTVTLFEIIPAAGIRISKIKNLEDDIALSLSALGIRIIAPIPGKGTVGIEVPNVKPEMVAMRDVIASAKFQNADMELPIAFGRTISNEVFVTDLTKMPHLLMAGATGQGKSVGLNVIIASLLYKKHPSQVKFVMVDPKKVELSLYKVIERHFLAKLPDEEEAVITDTSKVINSLNSLCAEMDQRYDLLKEAQVRNIKEYNHKFLGRRLNPEKGHRFLPYIVLVIDELADLMMTAGKEVETPIARLAQLARAIGIHLIVATQRPSVNIITGIIKANFPARLAFRVTSKVDSRTILDTGGADQLIGKGDMLFTTGGDLLRVQCAFLDTPEVEHICNFIGEQTGYAHAFYLPEASNESGEGNGDAIDMNDIDPLFDDAARTIVQNQQGSTSLLQRRLKLGYNRAGRLIDQLEKAGIVGPHEGSKARDVLIPDEYSLEQFLNQFHAKK